MGHKVPFCTRSNTEWSPCTLTGSCQTLGVESTNVEEEGKYLVGEGSAWGGGRQRRKMIKSEPWVELQKASYLSPTRPACACLRVWVVSDF